MFRRLGMASLAAVALWLAACKDKDKDGAKPSGGPSMGQISLRPAGGKASSKEDIARRAAAWAAVGAPPMLSCQRDEDCQVVPVAPGEDPCCDYTVTMLSANRDHLAQNKAWRAKNCGDASCELLDMPGAQGAPCAYEGRCKAGQCNNACGEVPAADFRSTLPAGAPRRLGCRRDDDCVLAYAPSVVNACCGVSSQPSPISRAHLDFVFMWRTGACKGVQCPERASPTESLAECAKQVRCVQRSCTDSCAR